MTRKGYSGGPFGQLHWRIEEPGDALAAPDLYCLHPSPFSGLAFTGIMPYLAKGRRVIAPDYPGYGGSDTFNAEPSVTEYAQAMLAVIADLSADDKVDLMGFHTGALVAGEIALQQPEKIRRLALVDIPSFDSETSAKYLATAAKPLTIDTDMACLEKPWEVLTSRIESQGPDRSFEMFVEQLRPGRHMNAAFHAAFTYDSHKNMPRIKRPVLALATQSGLLGATRWAGKNIPSATLIERLDITRAVLDEAAPVIAEEILRFLEEEEQDDG